MDVKDINQLYIAENCIRTNGGAETIDGNSVSGVQIHAPLIDAGTAATTYYGNGELLITDVSGRVLTTTIIGSEGKAISEIVFHQRSLNGRNHYGGKAIEGVNIKSYDLMPYVAPSEQTTVIHTIDASLQDYSYMLKIRRVGSDNNRIKEPSVKTAYFKSAAAGSTDVQIATGLVAYINQNFTNDPLVPVTAIVGGAGGDAVIVTAQALPFEVGKFNYEKLNFTVELVDAFEATVEDNRFADLTYNAITYDAATKGNGTYEQVAEMNDFAIMYTGANQDKVNPAYRRNVVELDAQEFEDDGTTTNRYDICVINWENTQGDFSVNVRQQGVVTLALPVDDNGSSQVGVATIGIMVVLDAYIVTLYGIGSAQVGNIT